MKYTQCRIKGLLARNLLLIQTTSFAGQELDASVVSALADRTTGPFGLPLWFLRHDLRDAPIWSNCWGSIWQTFIMIEVLRSMNHAGSPTRHQATAKTCNNRSAPACTCNEIKVRNQHICVQLASSKLSVSWLFKILDPLKPKTLSLFSQSSLCESKQIYWRAIALLASESAMKAGQTRRVRRKLRKVSGVTSILILT